LALGLRRDQRQPPVALAGRAEECPRGDDQAVLEQPRRQLLRAFAGGYLEPEVHRRRASRDSDPFATQRGQETLALAAFALPRSLDVGLVVPCDYRRSLDAVLRRS